MNKEMIEKEQHQLDVTQQDLINRPEHLPAPVSGGALPKGLELASPYEDPLYAKIVQELSGPPYKPPFKNGDYIATPDNSPIVLMDGNEVSEVFHFVPIFYYPEYVLRNPSIDIPHLPFVRDKTFDPNSEIAQRAMSREEEKNSFPCPEGEEFKCVYMVHQNYVLILLDHNQSIGELPIVHSFSGGEAKTGNAFRRLLKARKAPIYATRFQACISLHSSKKLANKKWYGLDISLPEDGNAWVPKEQYEMFEAMNLAAEKYHADLGIQVQYDPTDALDATKVTEVDMEKF